MPIQRERERGRVILSLSSEINLDHHSTDPVCDTLYRAWTLSHIHPLTHLHEQEGNTVEVVTTHQPQEVEAMGMAGGDQGDITAAAEAQALREHYMSLIADRQQQQQLPASEEHSIQAALQQLTSIFTIPH